MKKLTLILAALVLTLGFSQCKKTETPTTDEGVFITLTAGYGNGAKTDFAPATGSFVWTNGVTEYIYVGGSNHDACLGVLSGAGTGTGSMNFSGTLTTTPNEGETLHFFYLGKDRDGSAVSSLDFSNQSIGSLASLTNFHIAVGDGSYSDNTVNYATTLHMAVSFAYFDVDGFKSAGNATETVYLHGDEVYSTATINYRAGTITGDAKGNINLGAASDGKFVALIPSVSTETTVSFDSNSKWGALKFMRGIQAGRYYSNNGAALTVTAGTLLAGTVPGLFSVSATKMVRFSKGNLQYIGSAETPYWKFANSQRECLRNNAEIISNPNADRDLFGWGTGLNPTNVSNDDAEYSVFADWGNNAIMNGGNTSRLWRTLTSDEWEYLFGRSGVSYAKAQVDDVKGVILLPDGWVSSIYDLNNTNISGGVYDGNTITAENWSNSIESNGAVFLPASGRRATAGNTLLNYFGFYWSSQTTNDDINSAYHLQFVREYLHVRESELGNKSYGYSVRLVHNIGLIVDPDIVNDVTTEGSIFSGWTNGGGDPWNDPTSGSGGNTLGGWNNEGNDPWGN